MRNNLLAALCLGLCFVAGTAILGNTWRGNVEIAQTLQVTGSAQMDLVSDLGHLRYWVKGQGPTAEAAYADLQRQLPVIEEFLVSNGVPDGAVETYPVNAWSIDEFDDRGNRTGRVLSYQSEQGFRIELTDVQKIKALSVDMAGLVAEGVALRTSMPEYLVTGLAEVKEEVQALAAKDAMRRAHKVAEAAGATLGEIRGARMGVLQVTPRHSTTVSDYGINDTSSIEKQITAVVHARFAIR
jgi:hypothetical protein